MGEILFISDLHLAPERPDTVALFLAFLSQRAGRAASLYILGDLFDTWIGDDDDHPTYGAIRRALGQLTRGGTACGLLPGNRDFLLGRRFCKDTGCRLLRDPTLITREGQRILLMHGDLLCTQDRTYQRFRRRIRNPLVKRLFLWKSLEKRRHLAQAYREKSRRETARKSLAAMDVDPVTVADYLRRFQATHLVHGHIHRPGTETGRLDGRPVTRHVLAEWAGDRGEVLALSRGQWRRERFGPNPRPAPQGA